MIWLLLQKGVLLLLYTVGCYISTSPVSPQGHFPRLENIGAYKTVTTVPSQSTCGIPERNAFCQTSVVQEDLLSCTQQFCVQECAYRSTTPPYTNLFSAGLGTCVTEDGNSVPLGSVLGTTSLIFRKGTDCFTSPPAQNLGPGGSFTLAVWLKLEEDAVMTVIEKSVEGRLVFLLKVSTEEVQLLYNQQNRQSLTLTMRTMGRITVGQWAHVALQVHRASASLFLNGLEEDGTAFDTQPLAGPIADLRTDAVMLIGQSSSGLDQFIGRMQDFRFYPTALTNREIVELYAGKLPRLHIQPECRCPPSHPRVHPLVERYCIPNAAEDTTNNRVLRINPDAHPLHYINDNDISTCWVSSVFSSLDQLDKGVTITFDLQNGQYQVFYVILQFLSPQPEAVRIQRKTGGGSDWKDWQYLAKNCSIFGMEDNGPLEQPDSVNCLQFPSDIPYSRGNITFSVLTPEPNLRPGYNDFYNTRALQEFVRASQVRIHLMGQYHTRQPDVPFRHRYYGVDEITISGRCDCHGYADRCDTSLSPYRCTCLPESHTEGDTCERCAALFNDKPFRAGDQVQAYNCRPCQCHGHAHSCHYDVTVDPFPGEHFHGGGGVCDDCQHNTTGRNCELCESSFFRDVDHALWMEDVCKPCECNEEGSVNASLECNPIGGQCKCKRHVSGRQCNQCQHGFYKLQPSHPDGCRTCNCNTAGTMQADITCHQDSGQCQCKANVIGLSCDRCDFGFKFLDAANPDGCAACDCDRNGSLHQFCNPFVGQCECRDNVGGLLCDTCAPGFFGLDSRGACLPCDCSPAGSVPGSSCDPVTGQCACKPRVEGRRCDTCRDGFHSLDQSNSLGCLPCQCDARGTVNASSVCHKTTAQCPCKTNVLGTQCNHCSPDSYNLTAGCQPCQCDPTGTAPGTACDPANGQCVCLPTRYRQDCGNCKPGFFLSPLGVSGCDACDCHPVGALGQECEAGAGQCACRHPSLTGRRCDQCAERHFGFNPGVGRCEECACDPIGSLNDFCDPESGQCRCKLFVGGAKCDTCVPGASHLNASNYLGCSKSPFQQSPPAGLALNSSAIHLTWSPPDSPNTNMLTYTLTRDEAEISTIHSYHPFESQAYDDGGLSPHTAYSYRVVTSNAHGWTRSAPVSYSTLADVPLREELQLSHVGRASPRSATFNWTGPQSSHGPPVKYVLSSITAGGLQGRVHYSGLQTEATASDLSPFTRYNFTLLACTSGGCAQSQPLTVITAQTTPLLQAAPRVSTAGPDSLYVDWDPPAQPNGIIIRHELFMRGPIESQEPTNTSIPEERVFSSSGWLNTQPTLDSANRNVLTPPQSSATVSDLQPFSTYQFRVLSVNMAGSVLSEWVTGRTGEGVPEHMPPPRLLPLSPSSIAVSWETPRDRDARGEVTEFKVNIHQEQTANQFAPPIISQVLYTASPEERTFTAEGLRTYWAYNFTVTMCNRLGCVTSLPVSGRTLPAAPAGLSPAKLKGLNMNLMEVSWDPPRELNGPPPLYQVERTDPSFSDPFAPVIRGTRFPGHGYLKFPNSTLPANAYFTGIKLSFRTRMEEGLILCTLSPGDQDEYVALQIHKGRPFFLFDPQASAVAVSPENDGEKRYNDNQWHHVIATRQRAVGTIIVDNQYRGSASATSGSSVIGENTGVFIGGLPENFLLLRQDTGEAQLVQQGFSGCLRDVLLKTSDSPADVWEPLDWGSALERVEAYESWEGCPAHTEEGAYFLGQGFLELEPLVFSGGENFEISFEFKTDQLNAILLFAYDTAGSDYIMAELQGGSLNWVLQWGEGVTQVSLWVGLSYCDGTWNRVSLLKRGALATVTLNEVSEQQWGMTGGRLSVTSALYLGGIPSGLPRRALSGASLLHGFGGCIRDVKFTQGAVVNLAAVSSRAVRVNLDGCLSADTAVNCRGNDSILVYAGGERRVEDSSVQPFTEYLYRIMAFGAGGWTSGPWARGRSRETVPQSVLTPSRVVCVNGSNAMVSWDEPAEVRGVIERYIVKAYNRDDPSTAPIRATFLHTEHVTGNLSGLAPFTNYSITLTACSRAGCTESRGGWNISTPQEAPDGVSPPRAIPYPNALFLIWGPPQRPNGIITEYILYVDSSIVYRGIHTEFNVTGLDVYSAHWLVLLACTSSGCSNSSQVTLFTAQMPPTHMEPPVLTVLDSRSIYVQWAAPEEVNGVLEFYTLYLSALGEEPNAVYNSSELFEDHTLRNLVPGTTYLFYIAACTGGGCTRSAPSMARTEESTPENVPAPTVVALSPDSFHVSWTPPLSPHGAITGYGLWMNGVLVQNSSALEWTVSSLSPWSLHSFRVQACTAKGCALGPLTEMRTLEAAPVGPVALEVRSEGPNSVRAKWLSPARPNGNLTYTVVFSGIFYQHSAQNPLVKTDMQVLHTSTKAGLWVTIGGLVPFSNYSVSVNACNSQGCVMSPQAAVTLPPGAPDGVMPPRLAAATPTALQVVWSAPARKNAPGPLLYQLQMKALADDSIQQLLENETTSFSYTVEGLQPYTEYQFRLTVSHRYGETASGWSNFVTAQDRPGPVNSPLVSNVRSRSATITWQHPSQANGIITHYSVYQNAQPLVTVPGNSTAYTISTLEPNQEYSFKVEVCTKVGCSLSTDSHTFRTPPAPPEEVPGPRLFSDTPTSVLLSWERPLRPNGVLEGYIIERRASGTLQVSTVATVRADQPLSYLDNSPTLSPWTSYEYRVVASTVLGGANSSVWQQVTTRPSRPAGLQPPQVLVLGPDSIQVTWKAPLISNGNIERFEIVLQDTRFTHTDMEMLNHTISSLVPYHNYTITIVACSEGGGYVGGCTESPPTHVTTLPTVPQGIGQLSIIAISESFLAVSWQPPTKPNGPNVRYELLRWKTQQPLASIPPEDLNLWYNVYAGAKLFHEDKGLSRFTTYQYKLLVHNDVGFTAGEPVTATTLAGVPLAASNVTALVLNHTAIQVDWSTPSLQDLQGAVELYTLWVNSSLLSQSVSFPPETTSTIIGDLQPNTQYRLSLQVFNGAHNVTSAAVLCTTSDGEPEGIFPPEVVIINSTAVRVLWAAPLVPNGAVTEYSIYLDGSPHRTAITVPGYLELGELLPFTVYNIQVEVCTVYACVKSEGTQVTTVEDQPNDLSAPDIQVISSRSVQVDWTLPSQPNGIMLGYDVRRRILLPCDGGPRQTDKADGSCFYVECSIEESVCGSACYLPEFQVCCEGVVYWSNPSNQCCGDHYLPTHNASLTVCCGGQLLLPLPEHQCCAGYYTQVQPGEVCCPNSDQTHVAVGLGDACCGGHPYLSSGGQICCGGALHDGFQSLCCGGQVLDKDMVCCGGEERGMGHAPASDMACCGTDLVNVSVTICCRGRDGSEKAHPVGTGTGTGTMATKCCETEVISQEEECCNGVGYDPLMYVCADSPSHGLRIQDGCQPSTLCPVSAATTAYCGTCGFNPALFICTWVSGMPPAVSSPTMAVPPSSMEQGSLCPSPEQIVYTGPANGYTFTDADLNPYTKYEYRVGAWNSFGWGFSPFSRVTTKEDVPLGVSPPRWSRVGERSDIFQIDWQAPTKPNGMISGYAVLRNGQERYRGTELSFTDVGGIHPFQEYEYQLRACTTVGCTDSSKVVALTVQGVPENVPSPMVSALGPKALQLSWAAPSQPNGIIREYRINQSGAGLIFTDSTGEMGHRLTGLRPHTNYSFLLIACTSAGCGASQPSTGCTLQDAPAGVWAQPRHLVLNSSAVELYWSEPLEPNGLVSQYRLLRDGVQIFSGDSGNLSHTDAGLRPSFRYVYELEASTGGGSRLSDTYVIQTPASSPERVPPPYNVTITGPRSVFVAWTPPEVFNRSLPLEYSIVLNPGSEQPLIQAAGPDQSLVLEGLNPFTQYQIRVQACQRDECGVGERAYIQTPEAPPEDLDAPTVTASGATVIEVRWRPPHKPNGLITAYYIHRRPVGTQGELLVFIWSQGPLEFIDASDALKPYSEYEYCLQAYNFQGSTHSPWASTRTMEAKPEDMATPTVRPTGAYSVLLNWTQPRLPNGIISKYRVIYQRHRSDPTLNASSTTAVTVQGSRQETYVFGLEPYTTYSLRVEAVNRAGSESGPRATIRTLEAPPSGLANFSVEQREHGRALLLRWPEPAAPNGVIKTYNIFSEGNLEFSGLSRQFLFRRLEPYTVYTLVLEACTVAGCSRTLPQPITTEEAPPSAQPMPVARWVGASSVELSWSPPTQPNGRISQYQVIGSSPADEGFARESVFFVENNTQASEFSHNLTGLRPWTRYTFRVRVVNAAGHTDSPRMTVQTKQAPPKGLAPPTVTHMKNNPYAVLVSWTPPKETNGVLLSYKIQRGKSSFHFSFDPSVLNYTDEDLTANTLYRYAIIACTAEGCVISPETEIRTLEAPPAIVVPPIVTNISSHHINISWTVPSVQNGEITEYALQINGIEIYRGEMLQVQASGLQPHTHYELVLVACTNGGCTESSPSAVYTKEAPPSGMEAPNLKVTGSESVEVSWREPQHANGVITGYELRRDGLLVYTGMESRFHDFTLLPSVEYGYTVTANNSQGSTTSPLAQAKTNPSAPSGVIPPRLQATGPTDVLVVWEPPVRANGDIISYTVFRRDPAEANLESFVFSSQHGAFHNRTVSLSGLKPYYRYEVRVEACTILGCAASDWATVQTLEAPPAGQTAPMLQLLVDVDGMQTVFLLSWSPPLEPNGKILHFELYRRQILDNGTPTGATLVYRNTSTSYYDTRLLPYTVYEYQVWAVNSAGRSGSPWTPGRTGPAPPEGVNPPTFLNIHPTSAVVDISPPTKPNGIVSLYRTFAESKDSQLLVSEGTSRQQTLHGLRPFTLYSVWVEACTCFLCCSRGPPRDLFTQPSAPTHQPLPRTATLTSRSTLVEWDEPLSPNGVIESCELHSHTACPQPAQPVPVTCTPGPVETKFFGKGWSFNITGLRPYTSYRLRVVCYNNMGSSSSEWTSFTTLKEPPQYRAPFLVLSNLTTLFLDWGHSFALNGQLQDFVLTESGLRLYSGFHSSLYIPRTSDKTFGFQVTCNTDSGSARTPIITYNTATGIGPVDPTVVGKTGMQETGSKFYTELWFIILTSILGLMLLAILLGLVLQRALNKPPFVRERPPLLPLQKRSTMGVCSPGDSCMKASSESRSVLIPSTVPLTGVASETLDTVLGATESSNSVTLRGFTSYLEGLTDNKIVGSGSCISIHSSHNMSVVGVPSQAQRAHACTQNSLSRSASQLVSTHDKKSLLEDGVWGGEPEVQGHDSGMFVEDEELIDAIKSFSTVRKEHTTFTDTPL